MWFTDPRVNKHVFLQRVSPLRAELHNHGMAGVTGGGVVTVNLAVLAEDEGMQWCIDIEAKGAPVAEPPSDAGAATGASTTSGKTESAAAGAAAAGMSRLSSAPISAEASGPGFAIRRSVSANMHTRKQVAAVSTTPAARQVKRHPDTPNAPVALLMLVLESIDELNESWPGLRVEYEVPCAECCVCLDVARSSDP